MRHVLEHFSVAVAAITGVLAARGKRIDLFGVLVLALAAAFGGGTCRDVILGGHPVFWVGNPEFLLTATGTAVIAFYLVRIRELPQIVLLVADAFALAFWTLLGARKVLDFAFAPAVVVLMGVVTGVAGGILRDLLVGEIPLVFQPETYLYATAAFGGAALFVGLQSSPLNSQWNLLVGMVVTLGL